MLLSYIFGPSVVKYDILRRSKPHEVSHVKLWTAYFDDTMIIQIQIDEKRIHIIR